VNRQFVDMVDEPPAGNHVDYAPLLSRVFPIVKIGHVWAIVKTFHPPGRRLDVRFAGSCAVCLAADGTSAGAPGRRLPALLALRAEIGVCRFVDIG